jgi:hypothetical protein
MVLMNEDDKPLDLAIDVTSTEDLLRIVGTDRPRYGETMITAAEEELGRRGHPATAKDGGTEITPRSEATGSDQTK